MRGPRVYLDHNATTPVRPEVEAAVRPLLFGALGNPSSIHASGRRARAELEAARRRVAARLDRHPSEIVFTSGGTEADNLALFGVMAGAAAPRLLVSAVEHPAVLEAASALARRGVEVERLPVDGEGRLDLGALEDALARPAGLVSVMAVNNETGVVSPLAEIGVLCRRAGVPLHVDAVQAAGRLALPVEAELLSLSGHKMGGLPGAGVLALRKDLALAPIVYGGAQERGRRAGTESVAAAVALAVALALADDAREAEQTRLTALGARLEAALAELDGVRILGAGAPRVAGVCLARFEGVEGDSLLQALDLDGVEASSGSACASGSLEPSHVLLAMGLAPEAALGTVRFSMGWSTTEAELRLVLGRLPDLLARARSI
jgi:cysteine desulfurase